MRFVAAGLALSCTACGGSPCHAPSAPRAPVPIAATTAVSKAAPEADPAPYLPDGCMKGEQDVRSWKRADPAQVSVTQQFALNYSPCTWSISLRDGVPMATEHDDQPLDLPKTFQLRPGMGSPRVAQRGRAGVLLGYNHGEWGGALLGCSNDGTIQRELLDDNIVAILSAADRFMVFSGLSHLCGDRGRVVELVEDDSGFHASRMTELGSAPTAAVIEPGGAILVATMRGLLRVTTEFHVHRLHDSDWAMFYPVSIVVDGTGTAYVGMRGIAAEVNLQSEPPTETWLFSR